MTMSPVYVPFYDQIFKQLYHVNNKSLVIYGVHRNVAKHKMPDRYKSYDLKEHFLSRGFKEAYTLDLFDQEADIRIDLNEPLPDEHKRRYDVIMDIGTIEHVFDIKQVLKNSFDMIKVGGYYVVHTVANGMYKHGLYAINPDVIEDALLNNGFEIKYFKLCNLQIEEIPKETQKYSGDLVLWCLAQKKKTVEKFINPQQRRFT